MNAQVPGTEALLRADALRLVAGHRTLVENLGFEVRRGELWCLLGPNGSGKTTLLHTLAGLRPAAGGMVLFLGKPWAQWESKAAARRRGLLLQRQEDAFAASVAEMVQMGRSPHLGSWGGPSAHDHAKVRQALDILDLQALAGRDVRSLSGGERQRVALAVVLAQDPDLLLLDEPTAHLDLAHQASAFGHLASRVRQRPCGTVFATHDYNLAARFATHALLLDGQGKALWGPAEGLLDAKHLSHVFGFPLIGMRAENRAGMVPGW